MYADSFLMQEISSTILLSLVMIHLKLIPSSKLIMSKQKKQASKRLTFDFLQAPVVQLKAEVLSVTLSRTGNRSVVAAVVVTK